MELVCVGLRTRDRMTPCITAVLALSSLLVVGCDAGQGSGEQVADRPERVLPKDAIPAIFAPTFAEGKSMNLPPDTPVIGVVIGEEARAYSLTLLDAHEIVNDEINGIKFAVTW